MSEPPSPKTHPGVEQLRQALLSVEGHELDPLTAPWSDIEKGVIKLLGGPFVGDNPTHATVAMLLAAAFGERLCRDLAGFWFQNRALPDGAAVGFPQGPVMFSPIEVVVQALSRAQLPLLDDVANDLRSTLERARADAMMHPGTPALGPEDYRRLFDPGFVQFACVDRGKLATALGRTPPESAREIEDALGRIPSTVPANVRASMRDQIVGSLRELQGSRTVASQAADAPSLVELLVVLEAATETTRFAPAELWQHVLLPLLHIGAAESFPPLDDDDKAALRDGADPLILYVDTLPFKTPAADEDGVLGVFPSDQLGVLDPCFAGVSTVRLITVPSAPIAALCAGFDRPAVRAAVERFTRHAVEQSMGPDATAPNVESSLLGIALELLGELTRVVEAVGPSGDGERALCIRRAPEAEAASDTALSELRRALQGSRIILI